MGEVRTEIKLVNIGDQNDARRGYISQDQVRQITVNAVVDTGAWTLVINEETREKLGLRIEETAETGRKPTAFASEFAMQTLENGGGKVSSGITEYVEVRWNDRRTACEAVVLPGEEDVLLGAFPLEGMDLMVHPKKQEVVGAHGDTVRNVVK
jgi:predicted aspartyl protease